MKLEGIPQNVSVNHSHNVQTHNVVDIQVSRETAQNIERLIKVTGSVVMTVVVAKGLFRTADMITGRLLYWK